MVGIDPVLVEYIPYILGKYGVDKGGGLEGYNSINYIKGLLVIELNNINDNFIIKIVIVFNSKFELLKR